VNVNNKFVQDGFNLICETEELILKSSQMRSVGGNGILNVPAPLSVPLYLSYF